MEVGKENHSGLLAVGDETLVDESTYNKLLNYCFAIVRRKNAEEKKEQHAKTLVLPVEKKGAFALSGFITDCTRLDVSADELRASLEENGFSARRIQLFVQSYQSHRESIRTTLSSISSLGRAKIVDVNWRLDYNIKSSQSDKVNQLSYLVNLHTQEPGEQDIKVVSFTCSLEQLQDLVGKLKDAVRCVEKQVAT